MAKKEIQFKAVIDSSGFDQQISRLQQKLRTLQQDASRPGTIQGTRDLAAKSNIPGSQRNDGQMDYRIRQTLKELEDFSRKQYDTSERILANMKKREEQIKKLKDLEGSLTKGSNEQVEAQRRILELEERRRRLGSAYDRRAGAFQESQGLINEMDPTGKYRGAGPIQQRWNQYKNEAGGTVGAVGGLVGTLGALATAVGALMRSFGSVPREVSRAQGMAVSGTAGNVYREMFGGRASDISYYSAERSRAAEMARKEYVTTRKADALSGIGSVAGIAGGLLASAAGGPLGLLAGVGMAGYSAYNLMTNSRARANVAGNFDQVFTGGSMGFAGQLSAMQLQEYTANYQQNMESEKLKNPLKVMARDKYFQNLNRDLDAQRAMGLSSSQFYGDYLGRGFSSGFTDDQMVSASGAILGAGGSTAMAGQSQFALTMQRNFGISNATGVMGRLSSNQGTAQAESSMLKVLSEGVKIGLDKSEMAQEQRDFVEAATNFAVSAGATTVGAQAERYSQFSGFLGGDPTRGQIAGAVSAAELASQMMGDQGGPGAVEFAHALNSSGKFSKLNTETRIAIQNLGGNISADDPVIKAAAAQQGMTPAEMASVISNTRMDTLGGAGLRERRSQIAAQYGDNPELAGQMMATSFSAYYGNVARQSGLTKEAFTRRYTAGDMGPGDMSVDPSTAARFATGATQTGRIGDADIAANARASQILNDQFKQMAPGMQEAANSAIKVTEAMFKLAQQMENMAKMSDKMTPEKMNQVLKAAGNIEIPRQPPGGGKPRQ